MTNSGPIHRFARGAVLEQSNFLVVERGAGRD
jgi:hypothetical protein